ncbi:gliding motility-associated C-terminal domain-containing protein, partial [Flavobacteriales bacterium]|nr:gliding motility-associated C-terminal domain-containing protein [Flavobacteriales bacterium]
FYICNMFRKLVFLVLCIPFFLNAQEAFISGNDTICDNANKAIVTIDFTGTPPFTFVYLIDGENPSSDTSQTTSFIISTSTPGTYTLQSFSDAISVGTTAGSAIVTVLESPTAIIHLASDTLSIIYPVAHFNSQSIGNIISWDWNFDDNTPNINTEDVIHEYLDSSATDYKTTLIVQDINGCFDTAFQHIYLMEAYWMYIPTSFTPNDDKKNDNFCIKYHGIRENTFLFKVYNSQGDLMYQSIKPSECWDGTHYKSGTELLSDTYVYDMYFQDFEGWKHQEYGAIILIR